MFDVKKNARKIKKGAFLAFFPMLILVMITFGGVTVDLTLARYTSNQLQRATDSAALAAANALANGMEAAIDAANESFDRNLVNNKRVLSPALKFGIWDKETRTFTETNTNPNAIRISAEAISPAYFVPTLEFLFEGKHIIPYQNASIALSAGSDRNIMIVLDAGWNMNIYSGYRSYQFVTTNNFATRAGQLGMTAFNANIPCCYPTPCPTPPCYEARNTGQLLLGRLNSDVPIYYNYSEQGRQCVDPFNPSRGSRDYGATACSKWHLRLMNQGKVYVIDPTNGKPWYAPYPFWGRNGPWMEYGGVWKLVSWDEYTSYVRGDNGGETILAGQRHNFWIPTFYSYIIDRHPEAAPGWRMQMQPWTSTVATIKNFINRLSSEDTVGLILFPGGLRGNSVLERSISNSNKDQIDIILSGVTSGCSDTPNSENPRRPCTTMTPGRQPTYYLQSVSTTLPYYFKTTYSLMVPALQAAIDELQNNTTQGKKIIYLFSTADFTNNSSAALQALADSAKEQDIIIHTVGYQYIGQPDLLQPNISSRTDGQHFQVTYPSVDNNGIPFYFDDTLESMLPPSGGHAQLVN